LKNFFLRYGNLISGLIPIIPIIVVGILGLFLIQIFNLNPVVWGIIILVILCLILFISEFLMDKWFRKMTPGFGTERILKTGLKAIAKVIHIGELGGSVVTINNQPVLNLDLEVSDGTSPPYIVSIDSIIPRALVPQFQPGAPIAVRIDRKNPKKVVIDWEEMNIVF